MQEAVEEAAGPDPVEEDAVGETPGRVCVGAGWVTCSALEVGLAPAELAVVDVSALVLVPDDSAGWAVGLACAGAEEGGWVGVSGRLVGGTGVAASAERAAGMVELDA